MIEILMAVGGFALGYSYAKHPEVFADVGAKLRAGATTLVEKAKARWGR